MSTATTAAQTEAVRNLRQAQETLRVLSNQIEWLRLDARAVLVRASWHLDSRVIEEMRKEETMNNQAGLTGVTPTGPFYQVGMSDAEHTQPAIACCMQCGSAAVSQILRGPIEEDEVAFRCDACGHTSLEVDEVRPVIIFPNPQFQPTLHDLLRWSVEMVNRPTDFAYDFDGDEARDEGRAKSGRAA